MTADGVPSAPSGVLLKNRGRVNVRDLEDALNECAHGLSRHGAIDGLTDARGASDVRFGRPASRECRQRLRIHAPSGQDHDVRTCPARITSERLAPSRPRARAGAREYAI